MTNEELAIAPSQIEIAELWYAATHSSQALTTCGTDFLRRLMFSHDRQQEMLRGPSQQLVDLTAEVEMYREQRDELLAICKDVVSITSENAVRLLLMRAIAKCEGE